MIKKSLIVASLLLVGTSALSSDKIDVGIQTTSIIDTVFIGQTTNNVRIEGSLSYLKIKYDGEDTKVQTIGVGIFKINPISDTVKTYIGARVTKITIGSESGTMLNPLVGVDYYPAPEISYGIDAGYYKTSGMDGFELSGIKTGINFKYHF